jgi:O-acetyl-ADP-ribose deacetylase (regulator of RNase III)
MPYGEKKDAEGSEIDFDDIYQHIIQPAVARVPGLQAIRCDDIDLPGPIHKQMIRHIFEDQVAIVDTTTLNPNVFYELGIRHALKRRITILLRRKGTVSPFNTAGMNCIEYTTTRKGADAAKEEIANFINNALDNLENIDSLVYDILPNISVQDSSQPKPKRLTKLDVFEYPITGLADRIIGLITGDREQITQADIWVNSENLEMQMDRFYGTSTSATIRYLGAKKHPVTGRVVEDTIADELTQLMGTEKQVDPATVLVTGPGELRSQVKYIFHVAAVRGEPREGYRPIERIERCVTNALKRTETADIREKNPESILFPIFGTGPAGGTVEQHGDRCFMAAIDYLHSHPGCSIRKVYFYVWTDQDLVVCQKLMQSKKAGDYVRVSP